MDLEKALNILGLDKNFTEESIKKAYRKLMVKYHPDNFSDSPQELIDRINEKAKEINEARDFLDKEIKERKRSPYAWLYEDDDLDQESDFEDNHSIPGNPEIEKLAKDKNFHRDLLLNEQINPNFNIINMNSTLLGFEVFDDYDDADNDILKAYISKVKLVLINFAATSKTTDEIIEEYRKCQTVLTKLVSGFIEEYCASFGNEAFSIRKLSENLYRVNCENIDAHNGLIDCFNKLDKLMYVNVDLEPDEGLDANKIM